MARTEAGTTEQARDLVRMRQRLDDWRKGNARGVAALGGGSKARAARKAVKFIELAGALPVSTSGCRLSLQGPNGERLQLEMAPSAATEVVLQLCRSGWAASP